LSEAEERKLVRALIEVPRHMNEALKREGEIEMLARDISKSRDVLYLGRGTSYPLALEGALKLKEISYIHAEGYAAGELKHGPIALIDESMPGVTTITLPDMPNSVTPLVYALPVQLLAYYAAVALGTDIDQPRNLAKSVTVE
jgi:glutamine---fructose-6-phosphate transaminase (isomerizing)